MMLLERFQAKACPGLDPGWRPVRVKKTRQTKNLEPRFDSIETEKASDTGLIYASVGATSRATCTSAAIRGVIGSRCGITIPTL